MEGFTEFPELEEDKFGVFWYTGLSLLLGGNRTGGSGGGGRLEVSAAPLWLLDPCTWAVIVRLLQKEKKNSWNQNIPKNGKTREITFRKVWHYLPLPLTYLEDHRLYKPCWPKYPFRYECQRPRNRSLSRCWCWTYIRSCLFDLPGHVPPVKLCMIFKIIIQ